MDGDSDAIDYNADDPEDEDAYEADPALSYDDENPDDEKNEVEAYDAEINENRPRMTWVKTWISMKKMTSFQTMILKTSRNKS